MNRPLLVRALVFFLVGAFFSWVPWTIFQRAWALPLGLLILLGLALRFIPKSIPALPPVKPPSFIALLALALFAVALRFFGLLSIPVWPTWDDANYSYFAAQLAEKWRWDLFIGHERTMPLFTWVQGLFYQWVPPSLASMWLYPALLAVVVPFLGWWTARRFWKEGPAFLYFLLLAFSFWPLYYGRFDAYLGVFQWVVELGLLGLVGSYLRAPSSNRQGWAIGLGLTAGASFYSSMLFVGPIGLLGLFLLIQAFRRRGTALRDLFYFLIPALLVSLPMDIGFLKNLSHGHVFTYSIWSGQPLVPLRQWLTAGSYFTVPFLGPMDPSYWSFAPLWGGFLNPILSALFWLGLAWVLKNRKDPFVKGWACLLAVLWLPGLLFNSLECFRIDLIMPLLFVPVVFGLQGLGASLPKGSRLLVLGALGVCSLGLDLYHLAGPFHRWSADIQDRTTIKSRERFNAFQTLEELKSKMGPGLIFDEFVPDMYDQSLLTATYPFNAVHNPRLDPTNCAWAAVICDLHYQEVLVKRFPQSRSFVLNPAPEKGDPVLSLVLIPLPDAFSRGTLVRWLPVHRGLRDLYGKLPFVTLKPDFHPVFRDLQGLFPQAASDPLLRAWVLEKMLDLLWLQEDVTDALWLLDQPLGSLASFSWVDKKDAFVHHKLGMALLKGGDRVKAREGFLRASKLDPHYDLKKSLALLK